MNLEIKAGKYLVVSEWEIEAGKEQDIKDGMGRIIF